MADQAPPALTGPSELGQSISISVSPDVLPQDGSSQSFVTVTARNADSQPIRSLSLRAETRVGGTPVDFGTLSARSIVTDSDGRATLVYTAPPSPAVSPDPFLMVDIVLTPLGTDFNNSNSRSAAIRLVPQGPVSPPFNLVADFGGGKAVFATVLGQGRDQLQPGIAGGMLVGEQRQVDVLQRVPAFGRHPQSRVE